MSSDRVRTVIADLKYLSRDWNGRVDDDSLRRGSTVLRRLLVDGDLGRAWREVGRHGEPTVVASSLTLLLDMVPIGRIQFASVGGAVSNGMQVAGGFFVNWTMPDEEIQRLSGEGPPSEALALSRFIEAPALVVAGERISRRTLIHYVSNKLGGAHFDLGRTDRRDGHLFQLLDWLAPQVELTGRPIVYYELLSVGQALAQAPDIQALVRRVRS